jgi:heme exporter protein D
MWPDLGRYAFSVLVSYGITLALVGGLIGLTLRRAGRVRQALTEAEAQRRRGHDA